jgi:sortase A
LRGGEAVLFVIGLTLIGAVVTGAANARIQQARDERTLAEAERTLAGSVGPDTSLKAPAPASETPRSGPVVLGRIEIPRAGVSASIREGDDDATLAVAVGHVRGTARPGEPGNVVLAGHRDSFFRGLRRIRRGDGIWIRAPGFLVEYRVDSTEIVGPGETRVLAKTADDRLTLVTCYPFGYVGSAPKRFIVTASRILPAKPDPPPSMASVDLEVGDER